jgi:pseudouridine synthase
VSEVRLQKYLAACGVASRRASETLIREGRVLVNGAVAELGASVDPDQDDVAVDGEAVAQDRKTYIVLNKPRDTVTTASDNFGRKTVLDLLQGVDQRVFPVGRLDMDVEGVLLLTNDGELAHRLMHPSYEIDKVYRVVVLGKITKDAMHQLEDGVELEDGMTAPARVVILARSRAASTIRLTLHEGRKREVKRMCQAVGHPVLELKREAFGNLFAHDLRPGEWRYLLPTEIDQLRACAKLPV